MCWARVMEQWLNGQREDDYPSTWEGLYMLLNDAEFSVVAEELKVAVDGFSTNGSTTITNGDDGTLAESTERVDDDTCKFRNVMLHRGV